MFLTELLQILQTSVFCGSYLNKNYCFSWLALLGSCHTINGVQLILGGLIAARVLFTWQLDFKGKQPWKYKTVFAFFFNTGDFFFLHVQAHLQRVVPTYMVLTSICLTTEL